jgi:hypothetical protein
MSRRVRVLAGALSMAVACGLAWAATYLWGQGIDQADKIASAVGMIVGLASLALTAFSVWLAWLAWRDSRRGAAGPPLSADRNTRSSFGSARFEVHARRDAYTAQQMTINQRSEGDQA